ncbi:DMT family transporter [Arsenicitalea aurantiaca]|nr:DMT family transporter [Arsenicitalea aurantiaca]
MALRDWFWVILLGSIWGCSFMFNALLIRELGPLWVATGRVGFAALACWAVFIAMRKPLPRDPKLYALLALLGLVAYSLPFTLFPISQGALPSGVAAIINALTPLMTVTIGHFWLGGEKADAVRFGGVGIGFLGVAILSLPAVAGGGTAEIWAIGLCLLATVCYAVGLNFARTFRGVDPTTIATLALTGSTIGILPVALAVEGVPVITQGTTWAAWVAIGVVSTGFTFLVMYRLLPRIGATNFSVTTFIAPLVAISLGVVVLGEEIHPEHLIGMIGIFAGLMLIDGRLVRRLRRARA